ncbi:MAG TPA: cobalt ECF transporter T component CbiQ [Steroidobacteraceae bacterium]|nr:cobalt ECF transporter T component CbiQ [Steroidobacteraceae bacterium]
MSQLDTVANTNRWRGKSLTEKSLLALGMLAIAVCIPSWQGALLVALLMTAATLLGARVPLRVWWQTLIAPLGFLLVGVISLALQVDGHLHVAIAPHGIELAGRLAARALAGVTCLLFLALTTPATHLVAGLRRIGIPAEIAELALLIYRFLFLLTDTAETMHAAQAARLGHSTYRRHLSSLSLLIANLMPRALSRARALEVGLAARGWRGELRVLSPERGISSAGVMIIVVVELLVIAFGLHTA